MRSLIEGGDTLVLLAGGGPDGLAVLRIGRDLLGAALREARERGAETMDIGVDEPDVEARALYESFGFSNRSGGPGGPLMYVYEREL